MVVSTSRVSCTCVRYPRPAALTQCASLRHVRKNMCTEQRSEIWWQHNEREWKRVALLPRMTSILSLQLHAICARFGILGRFHRRKWVEAGSVDEWRC
jgi:hypothetical protein